MRKPFGQKNEGRETMDERHGVVRRSPSSFVPRLYLLLCLAAGLAVRLCSPLALSVVEGLAAAGGFGA